MFNFSDNSNSVDNNELYNILGVSKKATTKEINKAYRMKALKNHPDKGGDEEVFKKIAGAYEILKDEEKRQVYDRHGLEGLKAQNEGMSSGGIPRDIFDLFTNRFSGGMFGEFNNMHPNSRHNHQRMQKGATVNVELEVPLEQMYIGAIRKLRLKKNIICPSCEGIGSKSKKLLNCLHCHGLGRQTQIRQMGPMRQVITSNCSYCRGKGKSIKINDICQKCRGKTVIRGANILKIEIKKGMKQGEVILFKEESDQEPGIISGDIIVRIKEKKHDKFIRKGDNLIFKKSISLRESLCGCSFSIKLLNDNVILVKTEKGEIIKPSQFKKISNYGMPRRDGSNGDMYIKFKIIFPNKIEENIITKLEKILSSQSKKISENTNILLVEMDDISTNEIRQILEGDSYSNDDNDDNDDFDNEHDREGCPIQ